MITATSDTHFGESRILSALLLERRFRAHLIWRHRLLFDSRFNARAAGDAPIATIYIQLDGELEVAGSAARVPAAYVMAGSELERVEPGAASIRSWGDPFVTLELQLHAADVCVPIGLAHGPINISVQTIEAVQSLAEAIAVAHPVAPIVTSIFRVLAADGIIDGALETSVESEPEWVTRLWRALTPLYGGFTTDVSLFQLARDTGLSLRQLRRDVKAMTKTFALFGAGFREATHILRLRVAVLLLSTPGVTIAEVAERVGYGSPDALARAFRDGGLPAPTVVRDAVIYPD
ncbi:MAG: helix-turn-helix domain-containing protein [Deltaproteobacteria bacterium]|nr:helix-turn-helix domain-containing protein [Deltaproteobacteria bacterium]